MSNFPRIIDVAFPCVHGASDCQCSGYNCRRHWSLRVRDAELAVGVQPSLARRVCLAERQAHHRTDRHFHRQTRPENDQKNASE